MIFFTNLFKYDPGKGYLTNALILLIIESFSLSHLLDGHVLTIMLTSSVISGGFNRSSCPSIYANHSALLLR